MLNKTFKLSKCLVFIILQNIYRKGFMPPVLTALTSLTVADYYAPMFLRCLVSSVSLLLNINK